MQTQQQSIAVVNIPPATETTVNPLWLKTLLLAEITRHKYKGQGFSLTNPKIERMARVDFCKKVGIGINSKPIEVMKQIRRVYEENQLLDSFTSTIERFKLDQNLFI